MIKLSSSISLSLMLFAAAGLIGCASTQTTEEQPAAAAPAPAETKPAPAPAPAPAPEAKQEQEAPMNMEGPSNDTYEVVSGDNLWDISKKPSIYDDPYQWPLIYKANQGQIRDADLIYPGQVFTITRGNTPLEIDAAVRHARTRGAWSLGVVEQSDEDYLAGR